jgi:Arm DNA-binding domain
MGSGRFTSREIRALQPRDVEYRLTETAPRGEGRLTLRVRPSGLKEFYYRKRRKDGDQTIRIGRFEQTPGFGGITLEQARDELKKLVEMERATGNFRTEVERQKDEAVRARLSEARAARAGTFDQMLDAYVGDLRARGRVSAKDVENSFLRNVKKPFPDLCCGLAKAVTSGDIQVILAKLVQKGIRRGVNLLRSHLSAAFQYAAKADNDPTRLAYDGAVYEILVNPVALVPRKAEFEGVGERNLSPHELHRFWHGLEQVGFPVVRSFLTHASVGLDAMVGIGGSPRRSYEPAPPLRSSIRGHACGSRWYRIDHWPAKPVSETRGKGFCLSITQSDPTGTTLSCASSSRRAQIRGTISEVARRPGATKRTLAAACGRLPRRTQIAAQNSEQILPGSACASRWAMRGTCRSGWKPGTSMWHSCTASSVSRSSRPDRCSRNLCGSSARARPN